MKKLFSLLAAIIVVISLTSCQKEASLELPENTTNNNNGNGNNGSTTGGGETGTTPGNIKGHWEFVGLYAKSKTTVTLIENGQSSKTIIDLEYNTTNNTGILTIGDDKITTDLFSYIISTPGKKEIYYNDVLKETYPHGFTNLVTDFYSEAPFKRVNADSVYFAEGFIDIGTDYLKKAASGARIKIDKDGKLLFIQHLKQVDTETHGNDRQDRVIEANSIAYYKRV